MRRTLLAGDLLVSTLWLKHVGVLGGLDYPAAEYRRQDFPRHTHEERLIGLIESGVQDVWCCGQWWHGGPGFVATFALEEPHYGGPASRAFGDRRSFILRNN
jgi:hypothetical protein